uniref:MFS domain-containing protein n=1 Tax=Panagrellus redivivus TaxID=6233 RepID=A0A7E4UQS9_PANRE
MEVVLERPKPCILRLQTVVLLLTGVVVILNFTTVFELFGIQEVVADNKTDIQYGYENYVDDYSKSFESAESVEVSEEVEDGAPEVEIGEEHYLDEIQIAFLPLPLPLENAIPNPSQEAAKLIVQSAFFVGVILGFLSSILTGPRITPKLVLLIGLLGNIITLIVNGFMTTLWLFAAVRLTVGIFTAIALTALITLFLAWSPAKTQSLALSGLLRQRALATIVVGIVLYTVPRGTAIYYAHPVLLGIVFILNFFFVTTSPDWIREHGSVRDYAELVSKFASELRIAPVDVYGDDKKAPGPKRPPLPFLVALGVYFFSTLFSFIVQSSEGYYFSWSIEIIILGVLYLLSYFVSYFLRKLIRAPLFVFTLTAIILTIALFFLPWGLPFSTILQVTKFNTALNDHFVIFFAVNAVAPQDSRYSPAALRSYRTKLALTAEAVATVSRTLALFFVLKSDYSESEEADQIPKQIVAIISGILVLLLIALSFGVAPEKPPKADAELEELVKPGDKKDGGFKRPESIYIPERKGVDIDI